MPRRADHARQGRRAYHQRLPAASPRLVEERHQRPEVASAPKRARRENTHPPRVRTGLVHAHLDFAPRCDTQAGQQQLIA